MERERAGSGLPEGGGNVREQLGAAETIRTKPCSLGRKTLKKQAVTNQSAIQVTRVLTTREAVTETPEDGGRGRRCCWAP